MSAHYVANPATLSTPKIAHATGTANAYRIDLSGDTMRLLGACEISDDHTRPTVLEVADTVGPRRVARVNDHVVPLGQQSHRRRPAQPVSGSGDEDVCHPCCHFARAHRRGGSPNRRGAPIGDVSATVAVQLQESRHTSRPRGEKRWLGRLTSRMKSGTHCREA